MRAYAVEFKYVDVAQRGSAPMYLGALGLPTPDEPELFYNYDDAERFRANRLHGARGIASSVVAVEIVRSPSTAPSSTRTPRGDNTDE